MIDGMDKLKETYWFISELKNPNDSVRFSLFKSDISAF